MKRIGTKKQAQELQKSEPGISDLKAPTETTEHKYLFQATANDVQVEDCVISHDMRKTTGTHSEAAAGWILSQVSNARVWPKLKKDSIVSGTLAAMEEMAPQNGTEAMLAVQMIAAHDAALMFLNRATMENQSSAVIDANVLRATRLMRVFNEQIEAMQRLKGKSGQQRVTVEHVHVHEGGQAIVGAVGTTSQGRGVGDGEENRQKTP